MSDRKQRQLVPFVWMFTWSAGGVGARPGSVDYCTRPMFRLRRHPRNTKPSRPALSTDTVEGSGAGTGAAVASPVITSRNSSVGKWFGLSSLTPVIGSGELDVISGTLNVKFKDVVSVMSSIEKLDGLPSPFPRIVLSYVAPVNQLVDVVVMSQALMIPAAVVTNEPVAVPPGPKVTSDNDHMMSAWAAPGARHARPATTAVVRWSLFNMLSLPVAFQDVPPMPLLQAHRKIVGARYKTNCN